MWSAELGYSPIQLQNSYDEVDLPLNPHLERIEEPYVAKYRRGKAGDYGTNYVSAHDAKGSLVELAAPDPEDDEFDYPCAQERIPCPDI